MKAIIRRATKDDISDILSLLEQVLEIHNRIRPDLFKPSGSKYTGEQLEIMVKDDENPIFVYEIDDGVIAHAFCKFINVNETSAKYGRKTLFIDDFVVDVKNRCSGVGTELYNFIKAFAKSSGCTGITLHVWEGNDSAIHFYEKNGLKPQQFVMEDIF